MKRLLNQSIQFQIIIILVAVVTAILLGFGVRDYYETRSQLSARLSKAATYMAGRLAIGMVTPMWDYDEELGVRLIQSEMQDEDLSAVVVREADGESIFLALSKTGPDETEKITEPPTGDFVTSTAEVIREEKPIGSVTVYLSKASLKEAIAAEITKITVNTIVTDTLIILILFFVIRIKLITPVKVIQGFAERVSDGDLESSFGSASFTGELEELKNAVLQMVTNLKQTIREVEIKEQEAAESAQSAKDALQDAETAREQAESARQEGMQEAANTLKSISENIVSAAEQMDGKVERVTDYTTRQRDRVGETATAMEEMNATVLEVAQNAGFAAESADSSNQKASLGVDKVSELVASIDEVNTLSDTMKANLQELGEHAKGIGNIMNVITDIADQTNLLALNAAIEAARAGDAGRGFAVVADEVRKLAEKTVHATQEVEEAVRAIQNSSAQNIQGMESTTTAVGHSMDLAKEAGNALNEIMSIVEATSDQIRSIATASEEQSASSEEINRAMEDINSIAADISTDMTSAADALGTLKQLSEQLIALINKLESQ
jgi:methyl-accepting chemotaxis protein